MANGLIHPGPALPDQRDTKGPSHSGADQIARRLRQERVKARKINVPFMARDRVIGRGDPTAAAQRTQLKNVGGIAGYFGLGSIGRLWLQREGYMSYKPQGLRGLAAIIASKTEVIVTANHLTRRKFACCGSHALTGWS
jgi:hypothetical protein